MSGFNEDKLNEVLDFLCRGGWFGQMHLGDPGPGGLLNSSVDDDRTQVLFASAGDAMIQLTGTPPGWSSSAAQTIKWMSFHDGLDPETSTWICNYELPKDKVLKLANGDEFQLSSVVVDATKNLVF